LELKSYEKALAYFTVIKEKDSIYIGNAELPHILQGIGKYAK